MLEQFRILEMRPDAKHAIVTQVLEALEATLDLSSRALIPVVIAPECCFGSRVLGWYVQDSRHIELCASEPHPAVTVLHEVGHALDHLESGEFASSELLTHWQDAVMSNPSFARLMDSRAQRLIPQSQVSQQELLARSFEQWWATRLAHAALHSQWADFLANQPGVQQGLYWTDEEFEPVAAALEADLAAWGLPRRAVDRVATDSQKRGRRVHSKSRKAR